MRRGGLAFETIDVVADRGYFKIEDIEACERAGCVPHVAKPQRGSSVREGLFRKDEFRYDAVAPRRSTPTWAILDEGQFAWTGSSLCCPPWS